MGPAGTYTVDGAKMQPLPVTLSRGAAGRYDLGGSRGAVRRPADHHDDHAVDGTLPVDDGRAADGAGRRGRERRSRPSSPGYLKNAGYTVRTTASGNEALRLVESEKPALVVLDLKLPDIDGLEVCKRIRQRRRRADAESQRARRGRRQDRRARGRRRRLHDEAVQPARARRTHPRDPPPRAPAGAPRERGPRARRLVVDAGRREATVDDKPIQLAPKEFDLLWELLDRSGLVLTRDELLERVWGYTFAGDTRTVDVHVRQLRRKLGDTCPIVTVWGAAARSTPAPAAREDSAARNSREVGSGRARLPALPAPGALPLGGLVLAGLVATVYLHPLFFQELHGHTRAIHELRSESIGIGAAVRRGDQGRVRPAERPGKSTDRLPPTFAAQSLEQATGDADLLGRRAEPVPRLRSRACTLLPFNDDRLAVRQAALIPASRRRAQHRHAISRSRARCDVGRSGDRGDRRRDAEDRASGIASSRSSTGWRLPGSSACVVAGGARRRTSRGASCDRCSQLSRGCRRGRGRQLRRRRADECCRASSRICRSGSARWRDRLAEAERDRAPLPDERLARAADAVDGDPRPRRRAARGGGRGSGAA